MKALADAGYPRRDPATGTAERSAAPARFSGSDEQVEKAAQAPDLLSAVSSASSMWVANAATVSPPPIRWMAGSPDGGQSER
jgi:succinylarginine dihydrolase